MGEDLGACSDPENFVLDYFDDTEYEFDQFKNLEKRIKNFRDELKIYREGSVDSFYEAILYDTFFTLCGGDMKKFVEDGPALKDIVGEEFYEELFAKKDPGHFRASVSRNKRSSDTEMSVFVVVRTQDEV